LISPSVSIVECCVVAKTLVLANLSHILELIFVKRCCDSIDKLVQLHLKLQVILIIEVYLDSILACCVVEEDSHHFSLNNCLLEKAFISEETLFGRLEVLASEEFKV